MKEESPFLDGVVFVSHVHPPIRIPSQLDSRNWGLEFSLYCSLFWAPDFSLLFSFP